MSRKKNVWIVTYNYGSVKAGPVIRFSRYIPYFQKEGLDPVFVTVDRKEKREENDTTIYLPFQDHDPFLLSVCQQALIVKPDAIIFLSVFYKMTPLINKVRKNGIPCIYVNTMKLSLDVRDNGQKRGTLNRWVLTFLSKRLYSSFSTIVNSTKTLEKEFINLGVPKEKLCIIYNGVDTQNFVVPTQVQKDKVKADLGIPLDHTVFLFVGLLVQRKGVLELVERWIEWKSKTENKATLLLVGDEMEDIDENSNEWLIKWRKLVPIIKDKSNEFDIVYSPFVPNIKTYYRSADCFLFFSYLEGMPNVLLEAMATGLAMVTTAFEGFSNDYGQEDKEFLLLKNRKAEKVLPLLTKFYQDDSFRDQLKMNARLHAVDKFGIDKSIKKYIKLIEA